MAQNMGWIKLHRSIRKHWIFQDPVLLRIWLDLLLSANHEPGKIIVKNQLIEIGRGQFWTSVRKLAVRWDLNKETVQTKLRLLQSDGMIYVDSRQGYGTLLTIRNYSVYQGFDGDNPDSDPDNDPDSNPYNTRTEIRTEIRHKQEINNAEECLKNGKNMGLAPGDPDYFEEV